MPTYEYECDKCRRVFEVRQRISEPALTTCDACGGSVRRLLSPAPFILKGGGWYVTDYPSESRKKAMESEKSPAKAAASGDKSDKADSKADGKSDSKAKTDGASTGSDTGTSGPSTPAASSTPASKSD